MTDQTQQERGTLLALTLYLKRDPEDKDRYLTAYGSCTTQELYQLVKNLVTYGDHRPPSLKGVKT